MVQTVLAKDVSLIELKNLFGLQLNRDEDFFREWQDNLTRTYRIRKTAIR